MHECDRQTDRQAIDHGTVMYGNRRNSYERCHLKQLSTSTRCSVGLSHVFVNLYIKLQLICWWQCDIECIIGCVMCEQRVCWLKCEQWTNEIVKFHLSLSSAKVAKPLSIPLYTVDVLDYCYFVSLSATFIHSHRSVSHMYPDQICCLCYLNTYWQLQMKYLGLVHDIRPTCKWLDFGDPSTLEGARFTISNLASDNPAAEHGKMSGPGEGNPMDEASETCSVHTETIPWHQQLQQDLASYWKHVTKWCKLRWPVFVISSKLNPSDFVNEFYQSALAEPWGCGEYVPPLFENMGLVIHPNFHRNRVRKELRTWRKESRQTHAYSTHERSPVIPVFCVRSLSNT